MAKPTSRFAIDRTVRTLAKPESGPPAKPPAESSPKPREKPRERPAESSKPRMTEVTVKLPDALLSKLDRLVKQHSAGLAKAGRSTVLRWLLDQHPE